MRRLPCWSSPARRCPKPLPRPPLQRSAPAAASGGNGQDTGPRVFATPLARRMAKQAGISLESLKGTGPNGRIVRADIEAAQQGRAAAPAPAAAVPPAAVSAAAPEPPAAVPAPKPVVLTAPHRLVPHTTVRKIIARRLTEAKQTVPHFYVSMDIELDALLKLRAELNLRSAKDGPGAYKLSVNDLIIKAAAVTLRRIPKVNAAWTDEGVALFDDIDISVAVSIPDGLITPDRAPGRPQGACRHQRRNEGSVGAGEGGETEA